MALSLRIPAPWQRCITTKRWKVSASRDEEDDIEKNVEEAMNLNKDISGNSDVFLKTVSSPAYNMRRNLIQVMKSGSYDVLESNPWRNNCKHVYVLAGKNCLLTMKTRRARSEVEKELNVLLGRKRHNSAFKMQVEDVREGVLVFEDDNEASSYCNLLGGKCRGVAEIAASDVFAMCKCNKALAVLFRRGMVPPDPNSLEHNLKARNYSLED